MVGGETNCPFLLSYLLWHYDIWQACFVKGLDGHFTFGGPTRALLLHSSLHVIIFRVKLENMAHTALEDSL